MQAVSYAVLLLQQLCWVCQLQLDRDVREGLPQKPYHSCAADPVWADEDLHMFKAMMLAGHIIGASNLDACLACRSFLNLAHHAQSASWFLAFIPKPTSTPSLPQALHPTTLCGCAGQQASCISRPLLILRAQVGRPSAVARAPLAQDCHGGWRVNLACAEDVALCMHACWRQVLGDQLPSGIYLAAMQVVLLVKAKQCSVLEGCA